MVQHLFPGTVLLLTLAASKGLAQVAPTPPNAQQIAYEKQVDEVKDAIEAARRSTIDALSAAIAKATTAAQKARLETDLEAFQHGDTLPASAPKKAGEFASVRLAKLKQWRFALSDLRSRTGNQGAAESPADGPADLLEVLDEQIDAAEWTDLRCSDRFARSVEKAGMTWEGTTLLSPPGEQLVWIPSGLDSLPGSDNYQLRFLVERLSGEGPLKIVFPLNAAQTPDRGVLVLDGDRMTTSGIESIHKRTFNHQGNPTKTTGTRLPIGEKVEVIVTCQSQRVRVDVDGTNVMDHKGTLSISAPPTLKLIGNLQSIHLLLPAGTQFRILAAGYRPIQENQLTASHSSSRGPEQKGLPEDCLPRGRTWKGRDEHENPITIKVTARNQRARTATLDLYGPKGWHISIPVTTTATGKQFTLGDIKRRDAKVAIYGEEGNGTAGPDRIDIRATWKRRAGQERETREARFTGSR